MLELESGSNDPMAYMLTIILIEAVTVGSDLSSGLILYQLAMQFAVGGGLGVAFGYSGVWLGRLYRRKTGSTATEDVGLSTAMISIIVVGLIFLTFTATTQLGGNGYLAVYICGIVFGNSKVPLRKSVLRFMDGLTWLAQIVVFIMLGLLVNPRDMLSVSAVSLLIGAFMILLGRPISVLVCLLPFSRISVKAKALVSWVGLRGAVPIIFATYPVVADVPGASQIFNIVFFVTILSLLVQGTTVISAARRLKLIEDTKPDESDFGIDLAEEHPTQLKTKILTEEDLRIVHTLKDMNLPEGTLVMMIRRGEKYIVPNGNRKLMAGDALLIIEEEAEAK